MKWINYNNELINVSHILSIKCSVNSLAITKQMGTVNIYAKKIEYLNDLMKDIGDFLSNEQDVILTILPENV